MLLTSVRDGSRRRASFSEDLAPALLFEDVPAVDAACSESSMRACVSVTSTTPSSSATITPPPTPTVAPGGAPGGASGVNQHFDASSVSSAPRSRRLRPQSQQRADRTKTPTVRLGENGRGSPSLASFKTCEAMLEAKGDGGLWMDPFALMDRQQTVDLVDAMFGGKSAAKPGEEGEEGDGQDWIEGRKLPQQGMSWEREDWPMEAMGLCYSVGRVVSPAL